MEKDKEPFGMGVYTDNGAVVLAFTTEIAWLRMEPTQAASLIAQLAVQISNLADGAAERLKS